MTLLLQFRNRRSGQGDRLSGVSVALQYGSESEDDPVLSGKYEHIKTAEKFALCFLLEK